MKKQETIEIVEIFQGKNGKRKVKTHEVNTMSKERNYVVAIVYTNKNNRRIGSIYKMPDNKFVVYHNKRKKETFKSLPSAVKYFDDHVTVDSYIQYYTYK